MPPFRRPSSVLLVAAMAVAVLAGTGVSIAASGWTRTAGAAASGRAATDFPDGGLRRTATAPGPTATPSTTATPPAAVLPATAPPITVLPTVHPAPTDTPAGLSITAAGVAVDQGSLNLNSGEAKAYCESMVEQFVNVGAVNAFGTIGNGTAEFTLIDGVRFKEEMDIRCEGMTYKTKWTVVFQAVRS